MVNAADGFFLGQGEYMNILVIRFPPFDKIYSYPTKWLKYTYNTVLFGV